MNPTTSTDVERAVTDAIAGFGVEPGRIAPDTTLASIDIDSLDLAELAQVLFDEFGVEIVPTDAEQLSTVGDLVELVRARR